MSSQLQEFEKLRSQSDFVFLVYYRGHWCPFCTHWLRSFANLAPSIQAAGGVPIIATAEAGQDLLQQMRSKTKFQGAAIVDPEHTLLKDLKKRNFVDVAVTDKGGYAHGVAQPAVLVLDKNNKVLYSWAIKPSMMNFGGTKDRPLLEQIWQDVEAKLQGKPSVHSGKYQRQTFMQGLMTRVAG